MIEFKSHSGIYTLKTKQSLPLSLKDAWQFLSDPENLERITPPHMGFQITSSNDGRAMYPGQIITYKVSPFKGVKLNWVTEITHVKEEEYFVDEQRFGPYKFWHHKHFLKPSGEGVEMIDIVSYKIPMGFVGHILHSILIKKKLNQIFEHRFETLDKMFKK